LYHTNKNEDVVFEVVDWLRDNIEPKTRIVADHPKRSYLPREYKNVMRFAGYGDADTVSRDLRRIAHKYQPEIVYYNAGPSGSIAPPPIEAMLPGRKLELLKAFESQGRSYQRKSGDKFVIYKLL
jgi:hypothetical protein